MIIGVGVDLVDLNRFERAIARTPKLVERLFHEDERDASVRTLAGRFAAKEAMIKAVGDPRGMRWTDMRVTRNEIGKPALSVHNGAAEISAAAGIRDFHISISHDAGKAIAFVIAEGGV